MRIIGVLGRNEVVPCVSCHEAWNLLCLCMPSGGVGRRAGASHRCGSTTTPSWSAGIGDAKCGGSAAVGDRAPARADGRAGERARRRGAVALGGVRDERQACGAASQGCCVVDRAVFLCVLHPSDGTGAPDHRKNCLHLSTGLAVRGKATLNVGLGAVLALPEGPAAAGRARTTPEPSVSSIRAHVRAALGGSWRDREPLVPPSRSS